MAALEGNAASGLRELPQKEYGRNLTAIGSTWARGYPRAAELYGKRSGYESGFPARGNEMTGNYCNERSRIQAISDKANAMTRWLAVNAPHSETSQKHLDPGTIEQAYWHYGYVCASRDILAVIEAESTK